MDITVFLKKICQGFKQLRSDEAAVVSLCLLGISYIVPFTAYRFYHEQWFHVALNLGAFSLFVFSLVYAYHQKPLEKIKLGASLLLLSFSVFVVLLGGASTVYWFYPVITIVFFLSSLTTALALVAVFTAIITLMLLPLTTSIQLSTILTAIGLSSLSHYFIFKSYRSLEGDLIQRSREDYLTGAGNRSAFDQTIADLVKFESKHQQAASLVIFDLDDFKAINDAFGHTTGDEVLVSTAKCVMSVIRKVDFIYRYGGEEFAVILNNSNLESSAKVAEKMRSQIENSQFSVNKTVTISVGVAQYHMGETAKSWIERADSALYKAKRTGKNRVICLEEMAHV